MPTKQCRRCQREEIPDTETFCQTCQKSIRPVDERFLADLISGIENGYRSYTDMLIYEASLSPEMKKNIFELYQKYQEVKELENQLSNSRTENKEKEQEIAQLENEVATHLEALNTAQEWHERQKAELIEAKQMAEKDLNEAQELNQKLQQDNRDLLNDIHQYKQKNTNLENQNKTQTETLKNTQKELTQLQTQYQNHLTQEKVQLTKEIQLIKGVLP